VAPPATGDVAAPARGTWSDWQRGSAGTTSDRQRGSASGPQRGSAGTTSDRQRGSASGPQRGSAGTTSDRPRDSAGSASGGQRGSAGSASGRQHRGAVARHMAAPATTGTVASPMLAPGQAAPDESAKKKAAKIGVQDPRPKAKPSRVRADIKRSGRASKAEPKEQPWNDDSPFMPVPTPRR